MLKNSLVHTSYVLLVGLQLLHVNAVPADGEPNSLVPTWKIVGGNGGRATGQCAGQDLDMLKTSWEDACLLSRKALSEMTWFKDQTVATDGKGPTRAVPKEKTVSPEYERWHRIHATYLMLFGRKPFKENGDFKAIPDTAFGEDYKSLEEIFFQMAMRMCKGRDEQFYNLYCDDQHWSFITNGSPDPGDPQGQNIEINHPQCQDIGGIWYSPLEGYREDPPPNEPGEGPVCLGSDTILAATIGDDRVMHWCPGGLDPKMHTALTITELRANIKSTSSRDKTLAAINKVLNRGVTLLGDLKGDGRDVMAMTFLHEMVHMIKNYEDAPAVDSKGSPVMIKKLEFNKDTKKWEQEQEQAVSYGYDHCRNLARYKPELALQNPDNIAYLAIAMYLDDWDWSRGFAMPKKKVT